MAKVIYDVIAYKISIEGTLYAYPHRTLVDRIYNFNIEVVLFHNDWMITALSYIIVPSKKKSCRGDEHVYGHVLFCSKPHNDSLHHCEYRDNNE